MCKICILLIQAVSYAHSLIELLSRCTKCGQLREAGLTSRFSESVRRHRQNL
jgi:hypothetical protein